MEIKNILVEGNNLNSAIGYIDNNEINYSYSNEKLMNSIYYLTIYKTDEDDNKEEKIGYIEMTYMDVNMATDMDYSIYDLFDLIDSEKQGICEYLYDGDDFNDDYVGADLDILYIDRIFIEKKYRNNGIGSLIVEKLPRLIRDILKLRPGALVLLANPYDIENDETIRNTNKKDIEKLIKFYEINGFERIEDTQYLVRNMDFRY
ncbi:MAG: GNAT family N-acetyltransferase [Clostridiales bacterium]|nr:GNAT family N-acetyltransferase [Clostridiales bacterium]